ncbi:MAG: response regulator [Chloroflexi bacterium]|nr:response regulator [Chloroflexota bacterium]
MPTVVIIDDEAGLLRLLQMVLERAGYRALVAANGVEGVNLIYEQRPDVIVLDEMLPDVSGSDICIQLKADPAVAHIPVIIHSGGAKVYNQAHLHRIGAYKGLPKPSSVPVILDAVADCLRAHI